MESLPGGHRCHPNLLLSHKDYMGEECHLHHEQKFPYLALPADQTGPRILPSSVGSGEDIPRKRTEGKIMIKRGVRSENFNSVLLRSRREHENVKNHYIIHNRYTSLAFEIFPSIITLAPRIIRKTLGVLSPMHEPKKRPSNKMNVF